MTCTASSSQVLSLTTMGKSQSKLSQEQLADLQKNTYCQSSKALSHPIVCSYFYSRQEGTTAMVHSIPLILPHTQVPTFLQVQGV